MASPGFLFFRLARVLLSVFRAQFTHCLILGMRVIRDNPIEVDAATKSSRSSGFGEQASSKCEDDSRKQMRKREVFLLALGTLLESIHWLG